MIYSQQTQPGTASLSTGSRKIPGPPVIPWSVFSAPLNVTESLFRQARRGTPECTGHCYTMLPFPKHPSPDHCLANQAARRHACLVHCSTPMLPLTHSRSSLSAHYCGRVWEECLWNNIISKRLHVNMHAHTGSISWFPSHASWAPNTSISSA